MDLEVDIMKTNKIRDDWIFAAAGCIPVIWTALLIAPYWHGNLFDLITQTDIVFDDPMHIQWTDSSLRAVLFCLAAYTLGIGIWMSGQRNYRRGEEHGSAKWGRPHAINRKYRQKPENMNKILTQNVRIGFSGDRKST